MNTTTALAALRLSDSCDEGAVARGLIRSLSTTGHETSLATYFERTLAEAKVMFTESTVVPLAALREWDASPDRELIRHRGGGFFTVEGIEVTRSVGPQPQRWQQPVIVQGEVGILGILAREIDGVLHFLMQNKAEPGNLNGIQLSPTVQATRSNFMRVHGGAPTPYLEYFMGNPGSRQRVLVDVRQSEHGSWFLRKRNRNIVIEVRDEIPMRPNFHWLTLGQISELMRIDNFVNMETRSVISCLPIHSSGWLPEQDPCSDFRRALARSFARSAGCVTPRAELNSWITSARTEQEVDVRRIPLGDVSDWGYTRETISHHQGRFFHVLGVRVRANGREVHTWDQPMVSGGGEGVVAFVVRRVEDSLHVLVQLRSEGGNLDGPEIAPTIQCTPSNYGGEGLPPTPPLLDEVLAARPEQVHFDQMLSDEGGRFFQTTNRHLVVELDDIEAPEGFRWLTAAQLGDLLQHDNYLNAQARSLMACLQSLLSGAQW